MARYVFDRILAAGGDHGLRLCGMHALDSCRIEKAYRHFGHDVADEDHVLEAGLGFAVKVDKPASKFGDFVGREAVLRCKQQGLSRRLLQFRLENPEPLLYHNEPIRRDGEIVGYVSSGNYGHHLGAAVGLGYVACAPNQNAAELVDARYEIEVAGDCIAATATLKPFYDPSSERIRA
jgi:glycine cleavage system aminomethyltransferase T